MYCLKKILTLKELTTTNCITEKSPNYRLYISIAANFQIITLRQQSTRLTPPITAIIVQRIHLFN